MKLGKNKNYIFCLIFLISNYASISIADDKISTVPLVNLENLEPSFEVEDSLDINVLDNETIILKEKGINKSSNKKVKVNIVALDKITAKTSKISISIGETKKFGLLEIKALKCGVVKSLNEPGKAAYLQVRDNSDNQNNKVFVFNGWTFSSSPTLRSLDHPVYDLWLTGCDNV